MYTSDELSEKELKKTILFTIASEKLNTQKLMNKEIKETEK